MKLLEIFLVSLGLEFASGTVKKSNENLNHACIIRFLQIKGKLEEEFVSLPAPADLCRILLPLIYANHSESLCLKLWETKSVKAECVFEIIKKSAFIDLELKLEIYAKSKQLSKTEARRRILEATKQQKEILNGASKLCRSDPTYGGLFDQTLGINTSLIVLQENFCQMKFVIENKFISARNVNLNPRKVDVSKVDCMIVLQRRQEESERKLLEAFRRRKFSSEAISCLFEKYHDGKIFGWNLAKEVLFRIDLSTAARRGEDWRISKTLSDFNKKSSNCLYSFNWSLF